MQVLKRKLRSARTRALRAYVFQIDPVLSAWRPPPVPLAVSRVRNQAEFAEHIAKLQPESARRRNCERQLERQKPFFHTRGFCFACQRWTLLGTTWDHAYEIDGHLTPNWREHLTCLWCGLSNRLRAVTHLLAETVVVAPESRIYMTEQTTSLFRWMSARYRNVTGSEHLGDTMPRGQFNAAHVRNEDVTRLTFPDAAFDAVMSFEVFEHVPDFLSAFRECARVLRPGGKMLFSVPFLVDSAQNRIRARLRADGSIEHLWPPEIHGDPLSAEGCLCFQTFGWEMFGQLTAAGFSSVSALLYYSPGFAYLGGEQIQFVAER